jgi:hypothetical protein
MDFIDNQRSDVVRETIARVRRIMMANRLVLGGLIWGTVCLGVWLVLCFMDNVLHFPSGLRLAIVIGWVGLMLYEFWILLLSPILRLEGLEGTALLLEHEHNVPENMLSLVNLTQVRNLLPSGR